MKQCGSHGYKHQRRKTNEILPPIGEYHSLALSHLHIINTYNEHLYGFLIGNLVFRWLGIGVRRQSFSINRAL